MRATLALFCALAVSTPALTQTGPSRMIARRYVDGQELRYAMKAENNGATYEVTVSATTKRAVDGRFIEEVAWSDYMANGKPRPLSPSNQAFRLAVTLAGGSPFDLPDLSKAIGIIGPVTDVMTFYADLFLAMHQGNLANAGDHFYFDNPMTGSWADGTNVLVGRDHVDFDITLTRMDRGTDTAVLAIKHVVPRVPDVKLPVAWMATPVADTPNNFVQVRRTAGGFAATVGKETFNVDIGVSLSDGRILSATLVNPVVAITRDCKDAELTVCGEPRSDPTMRRIQMSLIR